MSKRSKNKIQAESGFKNDQRSGFTPVVLYLWSDSADEFVNL